MEDPLFSFARRGDAATVLSLASAAPVVLKAREEPNGWTVLHLLARLSLAEPVKSLLEMGADPEVRDSMFRSALHLAASADAQPEAGGAPALDAAARSAAMCATIKVLLSQKGLDASELIMALDTHAPHLSASVQQHAEARLAQLQTADAALVKAATRTPLANS